MLLGILQQENIMEGLFLKNYLGVSDFEFKNY